MYLYPHPYAHGISKHVPIKIEPEDAIIQLKDDILPFGKTL